MGVRGWNSLLAREGWLVPTRADNGSDRPDHLLWMNANNLRDPHHQQHDSSLLLDRIEPIPDGSAFHIDGLGLCFHLHAAAYQRQVSSASMSSGPGSSAGGSNSSMRLVRTFLPLEHLHEITLEFIHRLQAAGISTIVVYWDGTRRPRFKAETQRERFAHRDQEWSLLQTYCRSGGRLPRQNLATAFPISPLAQTQIYHTLATCNSNNNIRMVQCDGEADIDMARAAVLANRRSDTTAFVVANDSDFCFMANISYIPLSTLHPNENGGMSAIVLQRKRLAESFDLSDETLLVEAALLLGNDYYQPPVESSSREKSPSAVIAFLQEQDPDFRVEAPNILAAARMAFVRDLYNLRDNDGEYMGEKQYGENGTSPEARSRLEQREFSSFKPTYRVSERALEPTTQLHLYDSPTDAIVECLERYVNEDPSEFKREHIQALLDMHRGDCRTTLDCPRWNDVVASHILESTIVRLYRRQPILPLESPYEVYPSAIQFCEALHRNRAPPPARSPQTATTTTQQPSRSDFSAPLILPVDEFEVKILDSVKRNRVTIIQGETGCGTYHVCMHAWVDEKISPKVAGKSTRVPLMLLQQAVSTKIFICQPRRLAVKSIVDYLRKTAPEPLRQRIALRMGHGIRGTCWPNAGGRSFVSPFCLRKSTRIARPEHGLSPPDTWCDCWPMRQSDSTVLTF
jgi:hypothetical protein